MNTPIRIIAGKTVLPAELFDTPCGLAIAKTLPVEVIPNRWGDEFYFTVPVSMGLDERATVHVKAGDIGYWPPGNALAIFFGPTPLSTGEDPVPAGEVNLVGRITGNAAELRKEQGRVPVRIERA